MSDSRGHGRRTFLKHSLMGSVALIGCGAVPRTAATATPGELSEPEVCTVTEANIEGPFFKRGAPSRVDLVEPGDRGTRIRVEGGVVDTDCRPIPRARLEVWHADGEGAYDNAGYRHRARLQADEAGRYAFRTIIPGRYLNGDRYRPAHIHVKVAAPGRRVLTTQLYFEDDPYNVGDPWFLPSLVLRPRLWKDGKLSAAFYFVIA